MTYAMYYATKLIPNSITHVHKNPVNRNYILLHEERFCAIKQGVCADRTVNIGQYRHEV